MRIAITLAAMALAAGCAGGPARGEKPVESAGAGQRVCGGRVLVERACVEGGRYEIVLRNEAAAPVNVRHCAVFTTETGVPFAGTERWESVTIAAGAALTIEGECPWATAAGVRLKAQEQ